MIRYRAIESSTISPGAGPPAANVVATAPHLSTKAGTVATTTMIHTGVNEISRMLRVKAARIATAPIAPNSPATIRWKVTNTTLLHTMGALEILVGGQPVAVQGVRPPIDLAPQGIMESQFILPTQGGGAHVISPMVPSIRACSGSGRVDKAFSVRDSKNGVLSIMCNRSRDAESVSNPTMGYDDRSRRIDVNRPTTTMVAPA